MVGEWLYRSLTESEVSMINYGKIARQSASASFKTPFLTDAVIEGRRKLGRFEGMKTYILYMQRALHSVAQ